MNYTKNILILLIIILTISYGQKYIDLESGMVFSGYNDVQIPRSTGTKISLYNQIKTDPSVFFRARFTYTINKKHTISVLYAPFRLYGSGQFSTPVTFEGVTFPANGTLKSTYMFNSYRLTYRYDFYRTNKINFGLGLTANIRDAAITLESSDTISKKSNIGFVPIINFNFQWRFANAPSLLINGDALAVPKAPGRAEDVLTAIQYDINENFSFRLGYRILEGGANVEEVYNFTLIHYTLAGLTIKL